jgi:hypothetical protein
MKSSKTILLAAASAFAVFLLASPGHALPAAPGFVGIADSSGIAEQAKWKQKHGRAQPKHWNRGNHYGWSRGRGHKYGLRKQGRYY